MVFAVYGFAIATTLIAAGFAWRVWVREQSPLARWFIRFQFTLALFIATIAGDYAGVLWYPETSLEQEIAFSTLFFLLYAGLIFTCGRFLLELLQERWQGPWKGAITIYSLAAILAVLSIHSLNYDTLKRAEMLRIVLNGFFLPIFLTLLATLLIYAVLKRGALTNLWKRQTLRGFFIAVLAGLPVFAIDGFWPVLQMQWKIIPRGVNFHPLVIAFWALFASVKWVHFPRLAEDSKAPVTSLDNNIHLQVLTQREREIVGRIISGATNRQVADDLQITLGTVKVHVYNTFNKLGVSSRKELKEYLR